MASAHSAAPVYRGRVPHPMAAPTPAVKITAWPRKSNDESHKLTTYRADDISGAVNGPSESDGTGTVSLSAYAYRFSRGGSWQMPAPDGNM